MNRVRMVWIFAALQMALSTALVLPPRLERSPLSRPIRTVAPVDLPDVTFRDVRGGAVRLTDLRGRVVLLTFSNVRCVEESACVRPLRRYAAVRAALGKRAGDAAFVFVGVDERRDGPALAAYLGDTNVLGWTAPASALRPLTLRMGVHMNDVDGVLVAHAPFIFLLDARAQLRVYVPKAATDEELVGEVRALLGER